MRARAAGLDIVRTVLEKRRSLDEALDSSDAFSQLKGVDRAFARMLASTVLRRTGQIDDLIRRATERPDPPTPPLLHNLLRVGAAQIAFMNVPGYAAVDTGVGLAESAGLLRQKGLVNAVLRRIVAEHGAWVAEQEPAKLNIPEWLMQQWARDYGEQTAVQIALASLAEAPLDITLKDDRDVQEWARILDAFALPTGTLRRPTGGMVRDLPGYEDGMWWVQDAAAALPVRISGDLRGKRVADLCAAPGGKTAQLAAAGAQVTAIDRSESRLKRLNENLKRLRLDRAVRIENADAAVWRPPEPFDLVLLDAPCTATGTLRRNPDVMHLKARNDVARMGALQDRMLENAAGMLTPGGMLVYCTCSLQKEEGENRIDSFLKSKAGKNFTRQPVAAQETGGISNIVNADGDVRALPFHLAAHGGMDGFYIARLINKKS